MKIGQFVKDYIKKIFYYCDNVDHEELTHLMDVAYSKKTFDINFPFCKETIEIYQKDSKRYWAETYLVRGKKVRVSSQWFDTHVSKSRDLFYQYIISKNIAYKEELSELTHVKQQKKSQEITPPKNNRYKGNAIGNAQNLFIRNILSRLGDESFSEEDWRDTIKYFSNECAYCGTKADLIMEHAIPINKNDLGEHRLGNLVPSCRKCNVRKGAKDFRAFLVDEKRISKIEKYMDSRSYVPLGENEQLKKILEIAYKEVSLLAERYIFIVNESFPCNISDD